MQSTPQTVHADGNVVYVLEDGPAVGGNLPLVVKPDGRRRDPKVDNVTTLHMIDAGDIGAARFLPLWVELSDGERTVHVQVSGARIHDGKVMLRAEVEP